MGLRTEGLPPGGAELGCELDPEHWGRGLMQEALSALLAFGWQRLQLSSVVALCAPGNRRVHDLLGRLGFEREAGEGGQARFALCAAGGGYLQS